MDLQTHFPTSPVLGRSAIHLQNPRLGPSGVPTSATTTPTSTDLWIPFRTSLVPGRSAILLPNLWPGLSGDKPSVIITPLPGPSVSPRPGLSGVQTLGTTTPTSMDLRTHFPTSLVLGRSVIPLPNLRLGLNGVPTSGTTMPTCMGLPTRFPTSPALGRSANPLPNPRRGPSGVRTSETTTPTSTLPLIPSPDFPSSRSQYVSSLLPSPRHTDDPDILAFSST